MKNATDIAYAQGFSAKCAACGVEPEQLLKRSVNMQKPVRISLAAWRAFMRRQAAGTAKKLINPETIGRTMAKHSPSRMQGNWADDVAKLVENSR